MSPLARSVTDLADGPVSDDPTPILFSVRPGASAALVADDLRRAGLIWSPARFRLLAESAGQAGRLKAGNYELRRTMRAREILEVLASGRTRRADLVTIPEGWRVEEVAAYLKEQGIVEPRAFLDAVAGRSSVLALPDEASSFEGYLFPDSYEFGPGVAPETVVETLVVQFERRVGAPIRQQAADRGLSLYRLVTLASIVEREAVDPEERPRIAAVYHNRLTRGIPLEADPTVQYALVPFGAPAPTFGFWKTALEQRDLAVDSPYNTYRVLGLPPGPICSPGLAALWAAANPADEPWLYFVARGDGTHLFAATLEDHLRNVAQVRATG